MDAPRLGLVFLLCVPLVHVINISYIMSVIKPYYIVFFNVKKEQAFNVTLIIFFLKKTGHGRDRVE